jgi:hypothetical protein
MRNAGQRCVVSLAVLYWHRLSSLSNDTSYGPIRRGRRTPIAQGAAGITGAESGKYPLPILQEIMMEGFINSIFKRRTSQ